LLGYSLRHAEKIIVLDRFMEQRVLDKGVSKAKLVVIPPWSHNDLVSYDPSGRLAFRSQHGLVDKFVVMYSGNHSPCHSLDTLLEAARKLENDPAISFCFVGGGSEYDKVKAYAQQHNLRNILCLPYQPLSLLAKSLSAADIHVVVMGNYFTGIVHPCKIYNIVQIGTPVLYIGPPDSHVTDILSRMQDQELICSARHGDVDTVSGHIAKSAHEKKRERSPSAVEFCSTFSREALLPLMLELINRPPKGKSGQGTVLSETKAQSLFR
jgi:hypothetical protein